MSEDSEATTQPDQHSFPVTDRKINLIAKVIKSPFAPHPKTEQQKHSAKPGSDIQHFKDQLMQGRDIFRQVQTDLETAITQNPDADPEDLLRVAEANPAFGLLNQHQRDILFFGISHYTVLHQSVKDAAANHPDSRDLYQVLFGREPKGAMEASVEPINFYLRCHDPEDYAYVYSQSYQKRADPTDQQVEEASRTGGVFLDKSFSVPIVRNGQQTSASVLVALENAQGQPFNKDEDSVFKHEQQHALHKLFSQTAAWYTFQAYGASASTRVTDQLFRDFGDQRRTYKTLEQIIQDNHPQSDRLKELSLYRYLRDKRQPALKRSHDEFIAYLKNNRTPSQIAQTILKPESEGGIYDYLSIESLANFLEESVKETGEEHRDFIRQGIDKILVKEYQQLINGAAYAVEQLELNGLSNQEVINLLLTEPFEKWPKLAERYLEWIFRKRSTEKLHLKGPLGDNLDLITSRVALTDKGRSYQKIKNLTDHLKETGKMETILEDPQVSVYKLDTAIPFFGPEEIVESFLFHFGIIGEDTDWKSYRYRVYQLLLDRYSTGKPLVVRTALPGVSVSLEPPDQESADANRYLIKLQLSREAISQLINSPIRKSKLDEMEEKYRESQKVSTA